MRWALDSVSISFLPTRRSDIVLHEFSPQSAPIRVGTIITVTGEFPGGGGLEAIVEDGEDATASAAPPLRCLFRYRGVGRAASIADSPFEAWNGAGVVESFEVARVDARTVTCVAPSYYDDLRDDAVCYYDQKRVCEDCCLVEFSVVACGATARWASTRVLVPAAGFDESSYAAFDELVFFESLTFESLFPRSGGYSSTALALPSTPPFRKRYTTK